MTNHTAPLERFPSHVVTLRWGLQSCELQEEHEFTQVWEKRDLEVICAMETW